MIITLVLKSAVLPGTIALMMSLVFGLLPDAIIAPLRRFLLPTTFLLGLYFLVGWPTWPPSGSSSSLIYLAVCAAIWPFIEQLLGRFSRRVLYLFLALVVFLVLQPLVLKSWPFFDGSIQLIGMTMFGGFIWWLFDRGPSRLQMSTVALLPALVGTALSVLILTSGSASVAQMLGTYCALHGGIMGAALLSHKAFSYRDFSPFTVVLLLGFILVARYFVDVPDMALALALSPLLLFMLYPMLPWRPKSSIGEAIFISVLSAAPLGFALYQPVQDFLQNPY